MPTPVPARAAVPAAASDIVSAYPGNAVVALHKGFLEGAEVAIAVVTAAGVVVVQHGKDHHRNYPVHVLQHLQPQQPGGVVVWVCTNAGGGNQHPEV